MASIFCYYRLSIIKVLPLSRMDYVLIALKVFGSIISLTPVSSWTWCSPWTICESCLWSTSRKVFIGKYARFRLSIELMACRNNWPPASTGHVLGVRDFHIRRGLFDDPWNTSLIIAQSSPVPTRNMLRDDQQIYFTFVDYKQGEHRQTS